MRNGMRTPRTRLATSLLEIVVVLLVMGFGLMPVLSLSQESSRSRVQAMLQNRGVQKLEILLEHLRGKPFGELKRLFPEGRFSTYAGRPEDEGTLLGWTLAYNRGPERWNDGSEHWSFHGEFRELLPNTMGVLTVVGELAPKRNATKICGRLSRVILARDRVGWGRSLRRLAEAAPPSENRPTANDPSNRLPAMVQGSGVRSGRNAD